MKGENIMSKMECPICGKKYDELDMTIGEAGNPICKNCFQNEKNTSKSYKDSTKKEYKGRKIEDEKK